MTAASVLCPQYALLQKVFAAAPAVEDSVDENGFVFDFIYDAVGFEKNFPEIQNPPPLHLRGVVAACGHCFQRSNGFLYAVYQIPGLCRRIIIGNIPVDCVKIV